MILPDPRVAAPSRHEEGVVSGTHRGLERCLQSFQSLRVSTGILRSIAWEPTTLCPGNTQHGCDIP